MNLFETYKSLLLVETVKQKLEQIIQDLLKKHVGGRPFFNALDDSIKDLANEDILLEVVKGLDNDWVATSGGFGDKIYKLWEEGKFNCKGIVVFNGKMCTKGKGVTCWYPNVEVDDKNFVYVDDSLFSGGTVRKINDYLQEYHNSSIKSVSVVYDGSKVKNKMVKSLYRYYQ